MLFLSDKLGILSKLYILILSFSLMHSNQNINNFTNLDFSILDDRYKGDTYKVNLNTNFAVLSLRWASEKTVFVPTLTVSREKYCKKSWFYRKKSTFVYSTIPIYKYMWYNIYEVTKNDSSSIHKQRK